MATHKKVDVSMPEVIIRFDDMEKTVVGAVSVDGEEFVPASVAYQQGWDAALQSVLKLKEWRDGSAFDLRFMLRKSIKQMIREKQ